MASIALHLSEVTEIKVKVTEFTENLNGGWMILKENGSEVIVFFRNIEEVEKVIDALKTLKHQFKVAMVEGIKE
jgi:superfamily II DNA/RNA helicase